MRDRNKQKDGQLSMLDGLQKAIDNGTVTAQDIIDMIHRLRDSYEEVKNREAEEKRKREEAEAKRRELLREEARQRHIEKVTSMDLPLTWENAFAADSRASGIHADSPADGLWLSLENLGRVDMEYIAEVTGESLQRVIEALKGSVYQNPETWGECFYKGWETAEEYLSGNIVRKWNAATDANKKYRGYFEANVKALERVLPEPVPTGEIYVTLGSPWVPPDVIDDFMLELFGRPDRYRYSWHRPETRNTLATKHDPMTGSWEIPDKTRYGHSVAMTDTYGTTRLEALYILERTLNLQAIAITDEKKTLTTKSGVRRVLNQVETALALEKQKKLITEFRKWIWTDEKRKERLEMLSRRILLQVYLKQLRHYAHLVTLTLQRLRLSERLKEQKR